jgi:hypothetical protein
MRPSRILPVDLASVLLALAAVALFATSALAGDSLTGSGKLARQPRSVGAFRAVELHGSIDLELKVGSPQRVEIIADDNLLPLITTTVKDQSLRIDVGDRSFTTRNQVRAVVVAPSLDALAMRGSGDARVEGVSTRSFAVSLQGSGDALITGAATSVAVSLSGSGDVDAKGLTSESAAVDLKGSGDVCVRATKSVAASVAGSGDVTIFGNPRSVVRNVRGSGSIEVKN